MEALRAAGCSVEIVDFPCDLIIGRRVFIGRGIRGRPEVKFNYLLEVKDGNKPPSARKLTKNEQKFHDTWRGQIAIVENVAEALAAVGLG